MLVFPTNLLVNPFGGAGDTDPNFANVVFLSHFDGANGSTTFTDVTGKTITGFGGAAITTATSKYGGASLSLNGTSSYVSTPASTDFNFGSGNFTVEFWIKPLTTDAFAYILGNSDLTTVDVGFLFAINNDTVFAQIYDSGGASVDLSATTTFLTSTAFFHVAMTRQGTLLRLFVNGILQDTKTTSVAIKDTTAPFFIGYLNDGATYLGAKIDDARVTKGICRYTATFTPPSAQFPDS